MKYYIAGKINGLSNYREVFAEAEKALTDAGHLVMNPATLPEGFPYEAYMPICCAMIDQCEAVYLLTNWVDSKGAKVEKAYAEVTNKQVEYGIYPQLNIPTLKEAAANEHSISE